MNGAQIGRELEKRRGTKPSPGTIYPALKELKNTGLITVDTDKIYSLTNNGEEELVTACKFFIFFMIWKKCLIFVKLLNKNNFISFYLSRKTNVISVHLNRIFF